MGMPLLQGQQHVAARGEQRGIPLTEQNDALTGSHLRCEGVGGLMPGETPRLRRIHHREQQRQHPLMRPDPSCGDRSSHALRSAASHRTSDQVSRFDRPHSGEGEQIGIPRANPHQGESTRGRLVEDGQRFCRLDTRR